jgi:hypothetical protein
MNHPEPAEWIPFLFDEADRGTKERLSAHLASCDACAADVEDWKQSLNRLDSWKLPPASRKASPARWAPPLAWAAAAAIVIAAFAVGRATAPQVDVEQMRAGLKAELAGEIRDGFDRMAAQSSNALLNLEARLAAASIAESEELADEFVKVIDSLRKEDRAATEMLFERLQKQYTTDFVLLRRDLETLASTTDEEIENARLTLYQLASAREP